MKFIIVLWKVVKYIWQVNMCKIKRYNFIQRDYLKHCELRTAGL